MSGQLEIGPFRLLAGTRELVGPERSVRLGDRAFNVLRILAERQEEVVTKRELLAGAWPDSTVDEAALRIQIAGLRKTLGSSKDAEVQILNASGRGYMLTITRAKAEPCDPPPATHNLPRNNIDLIGRNEEVAEIVARLWSDRLVSLVGPGGVGKTSIALAIASKHRGQFERIGWVDFCSLDDPSKALVTVSTALHIPRGPGDPLASIVEDLRRQTTLLVIDNCEHVIEEAARLASALMSATTTVRILATSREALRVVHEQVYRVRPLSVPPPGLGADAAALLEYSAVELFVERARARAGYDLIDANAEAVSTICRHLDGVPLAIELAAAWTEAFPPRLLAADLRAHLLRAEGGPWDASARHRTLEAMLQWSYDRLRPALKVQYERLSVFRGEFELEAAVAVTGGDPADALAGLRDLVAKSLVEMRRTDKGAVYRLLFVPRAYAEEKLKRGRHEQDARRRHANAVLQWLSHLESAPVTVAPLPDWHINYGAMVDDLRAALEWSLSQHGDTELAWRLAHDGALAWWRLSLPYEGAGYIAQVLQELQSSGTLNSQLELKLRTVKEILILFSADWTTADLPSVTEARTHADPASLQLVVWGHFVKSYRWRRYREALTYAEEFKALADPNSMADQASAERMISSCYMPLGRLEEARNGLESFLNRFAGRSPYSPVTRFQYDQTSFTLIILAHTLWLMGDAQGAREAALRSVAVAESTKHSLLIAFALWSGLAHIAILNGDPDEAEAALDRLEPYVVGKNVDRGAVEAFRGIALSLRGFHDQAAAILRRCFESEELKSAWFAGLIGWMSEIVGWAGEPELGLRYLETTLSTFNLDPEDHALSELSRARASLLVMARGASQKAEALALLDDGLAQARAQGARAWETRILATRAQVAQVDDMSRPALAAGDGHARPCQGAE